MSTWLAVTTMSAICGSVGAPACARAFSPAAASAHSASVLMLGFIGVQAGENWTRWRYSLHYVDYVVLAAVAAGVEYLIARWRRRGGRDQPAADATSP